MFKSVKMSRLCGIGLLLKDNDDYLEVEEVVKDGPAYLSGKVQTSDIVKTVDSVRVGRRHGYALDNVKKLILGLPDTAVTLRILRSHKEFDVIITRAPPRTSSTAHLFGLAKGGSPLVAVPTPFVDSPTAGDRVSLQRSNSMPVHTSGADVRLSGGHFSVVLDYQAKMAHELSLEPGQTVQVTRKHRTGWWEGIVSDGKKGWFPSNVVCESDLPANADEQPSRAAQVDVTKAPGYGVYASKPPQHAADVTSAPGYGAYAQKVPAQAGGGAGVSEVRARGHAHNSTRRGIPAALVKESIALLGDLKQLAASLRGGLRRGGVNGAQRNEASSSGCGASGALDGGGDDKLLGAEAVVAALRAELVVAQRESQKCRERCARLEQEKNDVADQYVRLEAEMKTCSENRDRALNELEEIKQDPDLYFAGLTGGGRVAGGAGGGEAKRYSFASHASSHEDVSVDFDDDDVDFESHPPAPTRVEA